MKDFSNLLNYIEETAESTKNRNHLKDRLKAKEWIDKSMLFCIAVRGYLKETKMSQAELAINLGKSEQTLSRLLSGKENLTLSTISEIESVLSKRFTAFGLELSDYEWVAEARREKQNKTQRGIMNNRKHEAAYLQIEVLLCEQNNTPENFEVFELAKAA
jgi:transcriptional regulator with XRE-family HTH domain